MDIAVDNSLWITGDHWGSTWEINSISLSGKKAYPGENAGGKYIIAMLDKSGVTLYSDYFDLFGTDEDEEIKFSVRVPALPEVSTIEIKDRTSNSTLFDYEITGEKPTVALMSTPVGEVNSTVNISWSGQDPDSHILKYKLEYSYDDGKPGTWQGISVANFLPVTNLDADFSLARGSISQSRLRVIASDGVNNTVSAISPPFVVPMHLPPIIITAPKPNASWKHGAQKSFSVDIQAEEYEDLAADSITWSSSKDGIFGHGKELNYAGLSAGAHTITVSVNTPGGTATQVIENIMVAEKPPVVSITLGDGTQPDLACNELKFDAVPGDAPFEEMVWSYFPIGSDKEQSNFVKQDQLPIKHSSDSIQVVYFFVRDTVGFSDEKQLRIKPNKCPPPTPPSGG